MKRLSYLIVSAAATMLMLLGVASCGDNTDFSKAHVLTDAELAEMQRQKHIADSLAQIINADTIQYVEIEDYVAPDGIWSSKTFEVDTKAMAIVFGITEEEAILGLNGAPGAPEFTNVVIQGTTHMDQATTSNNRTNGLWGHWFKYNGNATEAGYNEEDSRFYVEWAGYYDEEEATVVDAFFNIGQFPGRSVAGDHYQAIECFIYGDHRMAVVIDYKILERQAVTGGVVASHNLEMNCEYNGSYTTSDCEFDMNQLLSELGASSWSDITWVGINADGSYNQVYNAGDANENQGFWFDKNGYPGSYGDDSSVYACFPTDTEVNVFTAAPMPNVFTAGMSVTIHFAAVYGDRIVEYHLLVNVVEPGAIEGVVVYETEYTVQQMYRNDYSFSLLPIDAAAICRALGIDNLSEANGLARNGDGDYTKDYCADGQGFWYRADGTYGHGDGAVIYIARIVTNDTEADDYNNLRLGIMPVSDTSTLEPISVVYAFIANNKIAEIKINWSLGETDEGFAKPHDYAADILAATNAGNIDFVIECEWNGEGWGDLLEFDSDAVKSALGIDDLSTTMRYAVLPDGSVFQQGDDPAYWYGADGYVTGWNADGRIYASYYGYDPEWPEDEYSLYVGTMGLWENGYTCRVGDVYNIVYGLYAKNTNKTYTFSIQATVTGEETALSAPAAARMMVRAGNPPTQKSLKRIAHRAH